MAKPSITDARSVTADPILIESEEKTLRQWPQALSPRIQQEGGE